VGEPELLDVLLVEDNPADTDLTIHALQKSGAISNICHVWDGEEALDFLFCRGTFASRDFSRPPRVILLDLKLPKRDGCDVLRELKSDPRTRSIPVIILTSSKEERDLLQTYRLGVNSYIQKPVSFVEFQEVVRQLGLYWFGVNSAPPPSCFTSE